MTETQLPAHSPLGASSAERWMKCPGSVALLQTLDGEGEDSEYAQEGTDAHELGMTCLRLDMDPWDYLGDDILGFPVTEDMAEAVQVYTDYCKSKRDLTEYHAVETEIYDPDFHPNFHGTADFVCGGPGGFEIVDYKHGRGLYVEVEHNPQLMYYAYGVLRCHPEAQGVKITIVQPRLEWVSEPIRSWTLTAKELSTWAENDLHPAMLRTEWDDSLEPGEWCRFCDAKLICSAAREAFELMARLGKEGIDVTKATNEQLAEWHPQIQTAKFFMKAVETECYNRAMKHDKVAGTKLVEGRADRVWKEGAEEAALEAFPEDQRFAIYKPQDMKSPAQLEKIPGGKDFAARWAHKPQGGYSLVSSDSPKQEVTPPKASDIFATVTE